MGLTKTEDSLCSPSLRPNALAVVGRIGEEHDRQQKGEGDGDGLPASAPSDGRHSDEYGECPGEHAGLEPKLVAHEHLDECADAVHGEEQWWSGPHEGHDGPEDGDGADVLHPALSLIPEGPGMQNEVDGRLPEIDSSGPGLLLEMPPKEQVVVVQSEIAGKSDEPQRDQNDR